MLEGAYAVVGLLWPFLICKQCKQGKQTRSM